MTLEKADIDTHHIIGDRFKSENKCCSSVLLSLHDIKLHS